MILADDPFARFIALSDWLYEKTDATHKIALDRLAQLVTQWLCLQGSAPDEVSSQIAQDYAGQIASTAPKIKTVKAVAPGRQVRHLAA